MARGATTKRRRTRKKQLARVRKTEAKLLETMRRNEHVRGNIYDVPEVKRAMKKHDESLMMKAYLRRDRRRTARRSRRE